MVTCLEPQKKLDVLQGFRGRRLLGAKLIIPQGSQYQWKLDTSAHMVKRWTHQLNVRAQMEALPLLPTTTGSPASTQTHAL